MQIQQRPLLQPQEMQDQPATSWCGRYCIDPIYAGLSCLIETISRAISCSWLTLSSCCYDQNNDIPLGPVALADDPEAIEMDDIPGIDDLYRRWDESRLVPFRRARQAQEVREKFQIPLDERQPFSSGLVRLPPELIVKYMSFLDELDLLRLGMSDGYLSNLSRDRYALNRFSTPVLKAVLEKGPIYQGLKVPSIVRKMMLHQIVGSYYSVNIPHPKIRRLARAAEVPLPDNNLEIVDLRNNHTIVIPLDKVIMGFYVIQKPSLGLIFIDCNAKVTFVPWDSILQGSLPDDPPVLAPAIDGCTEETFSWSWDENSDIAIFENYAAIAYDNHVKLIEMQMVDSKIVPNTRIIAFMQPSLILFWEGRLVCISSWQVSILALENLKELFSCGNMQNAYPQNAYPLSNHQILLTYRALAYRMHLDKIFLGRVSDLHLGQDFFLVDSVNSDNLDDYRLRHVLMMGDQIFAVSRTKFHRWRKTDDGFEPIQELSLNIDRSDMLLTTDLVKFGDRILWTTMNYHLLFPPLHPEEGIILPFSSLLQPIRQVDDYLIVDKLDAEDPDAHTRQLQIYKLDPGLLQDAEDHKE